jgi:DNA transformation protein and related proteins
VSDFVDFLTEQLAPVRGLVTARFFGGIGLSAQGTLFGMVMGNSLYFAVDDATRAHYEKSGSHCFSYATKKGRVNVNRYFEVPAQAIEEPAQLVELANEAIEAARRYQRAKAKRR